MLTPTARARWDQLIAARDWDERRITYLAAYCAAWGRWADAESWLADPAHGPVITIRDDKGNVKSHGPAPQLAVGERAAKEMTRLGSKLGL